MDAILYWNDVALEAVRVAHSNNAGEQIGPPLSARALGIVHLAMYDALAGVANSPSTLPPYMPGLPSVPAGASTAAAVAAAARSTLSALYPSQSEFFELRYRQAGLTGPGVDSGRDFGLEVAQAILADRAGDPGNSDLGYVPSLARGAHREDPDNPEQVFLAPFYGQRSRLFAATTRYGLDAPPALDSGEYLRALRQVRGKGIRPDLTGTLPSALPRRTVDEMLVGLYWSYDGSINIGTPPRQFNQIVRELAIARGNSEADNARLFAFVNAAMADAGILAWEQKYLHDLWRPVLGIREHDPSFGPAAFDPANNIRDDSDPDWLPLGAQATNATLRETLDMAMPPGAQAIEAAVKNFTPPFPAYPSGHATFVSAGLHAARLFFRPSLHGNRSPDNLLKGLSFVSDELDGFNRDNRGTVRPRHVREFPGGLWNAIIEVGFSRVYLGVHWSFDAFALDAAGNPDLDCNVGGVPLGLNIAEDIFAAGSGLAPVRP